MAVVYEALVEAVCPAGKFFCEKCLTFGSKASPGKYARTARLPIHLACLEADFPYCQVLSSIVKYCQVLSSIVKYYQAWSGSR